MLPTPISNLANPQDNEVNNNRQQKGTGFTNIGSILNANQGAGAKIGQALGSNLAGQANDVKAGIQQSQDQFNTDKTNAVAGANTAINSAQNYSRGAGESADDYSARLSGNGAPTDTTDYSKIGTDLNSAAYSGPTTLSNHDQLNSQAANVNALGRLAGTQQGQSQLLRSQVAQKGNYSQGQNALDSLLLGQGGQQYVQQGRQEANQVGGLVNTAISNASNQANAAQQSIENNKANVLHNLQASLTGDGSVDPTANPSGITGLETDATNQAKDFSNKGTRIQQLLQGRDANGNTITSDGVKDANGNILSGSQLTSDDQALIKSMGDYGIANGSVFRDPSDSNAYKSALAQIGGRLVIPTGGQYYKGNQQTAAGNLAKILGDTQAQSSISSTPKFNTQLLAQDGSEQNILGNLTGRINSDMSRNQDVINQLAQLKADHPTGNVQDLYDRDNAGYNGAIHGIMGAYNKATGGNFAQAYNDAGDKNLSSIFDSASNPYRANLANDQNSLTNNSTDLQNAVLRMLSGQG